MTKHLLDLETLALAIGIIGVLLASWGIGSAIGDLRDLADARLNGPRHLVAVGNGTRAIFRMAMQSVTLVAGGMMTLNQEAAHHPGAVVLLFCIVIQGTLTLILTIIDRMRRVQLVKLAEFELAADAARLGRRKYDATLAAVCRGEGDK